MNDMTAIIAPKSDQINSDDLISGPRTIAITDVDIRPGTEQPCSIFFDGDNGKPWKPCKSMARVLVAAWGPDAKTYVGRAVTLYRDPSVKWGGMEVGGIRISHMTHIERDMMMALTATKGKRAPYTVKVLRDAPQASPTQKPDKAAEGVNALLEAIAAGEDVTAHKVMQQREWLAQNRPELSAKIDTALAARDAIATAETESDPFAE